MTGKECHRIGVTVEEWMCEVQKPGPKGGGGGAKWRWGKNWQWGAYGSI